MQTETLAFLNDATARLTHTASLIRADTATALATNDPPQVITHFDQLRKAGETIKLARKAIEEIEDRLSKEQIPDLMREHKIKTMTVEGIGRCTVAYRFSCSIATEDKKIGHDWLKSNGYESLVTETVNSSTLAAFAKDLLETEGKELPPEIFKVGTSPYTSITKA